MKAINYVCFKLVEKVTISVKKNKNNFISVIGNKFAISIRWENQRFDFSRSFPVIDASVTYIINKKGTKD